MLTCVTVFNVCSPYCGNTVLWLTFCGTKKMMMVDKRGRGVAHFDGCQKMWVKADVRLF